ncbi:MAG TPA: RNA-binding S4 domain-containing protein [Burkholderiales bacterium]|jgi:ribosome-associated protein
MRRVHFAIRGEYIELHKLLKAVGIAPSGAAGKIMAASGQVRVNGAVETRKTRKLKPGFQVRVGEVEIHVQAEPAGETAGNAAA